MRKFYVFIISSIIFSLLGCGNNPGPGLEDAPKNLEPKKHSEPEPQESPPPADNKWLSQEAWGEPTPAIDFSSEKSLLSDSRVIEIHKNQIPHICEEYVLWRVRHDGSCWLSSGMTQLIFHMIEAGEAKFDETVARLKAIIATDKRPEQAQDQEIIRDFFQILGLMREKMDHRYSLELRNHSNVYAALDRGFRRLLASWMRQKSDYWADHANKIERPGSWGSFSDLEGIIQELGFNYGGISSDGAFGGAPATQTYFELSNYVTPQELKSIRAGNPQQSRDLIRRKMPSVMSFRSSPGFADVAVLRSVAEKIRGQHR